MSSAQQRSITICYALLPSFQVLKANVGKKKYALSIVDTFYTEKSI